MCWTSSRNVTAINSSNSIFEVGVEFGVMLYLERERVNTGWLDKYVIDWWYRKYLDHLVKVASKIVSLCQLNRMGLTMK